MADDIKEAYTVALRKVQELREQVDKVCAELMIELQWCLDTPAEQTMREAEERANTAMARLRTFQREYDRMVSDRDAWKAVADNYRGLRGRPYYGG